MSQNDKGEPKPQPAVPVDPQRVTEVRPLGLEVAKRTDVGRLRPHNEDYVDHYVPPDPQQRAKKGVIYLVADGMGGHQAGEVASRGAVEVVINEYYKDTGHDIGTSLVRAFRAANQRIYDQAQADPSKAGMGTTLVAAVLLGRKVYVANVGDSRAYLINRQGITQITEDHSWVDEQVRAGLLTYEQARRHPQRNLVTRALGSRPAVEVDLFEGEIGEGDTLLLCTDGLTGPVEDPEIAAIVREHPPEEASDLLVAQANERGGSDNVTLLLVSAPREPAVAPVPLAAEAEPARSFPLVPVLAGLAVVVILALAALFVGPSLWGGTPTATPTPLATETPLPPSATLAPTPSPEATAEVAPVVTDTVPAPVEPAEATPSEPTATLAATFTPTTEPTPRPTNTPLPPSPRSPLRTPRSTDPAPTLLEPNAGAQLRGRTTFRWSYAGSLTGDKQFQVLIWRQGDAQHNGAAAYTDQTQQEIDLDLVPRITDGGAGPYRWSVVVVDTVRDRRTSPEAEPRAFTYLGAEAPPQEPPPPPDPTPTVDDDEESSGR